MIMNASSFLWKLSRSSMSHAVYVTLALAVMITVSVSGCGTAPSPASATTKVVSPTLFALSQTGELARYQANGTRNWYIAASSGRSFQSIAAPMHMHLISDGEILYSATDTLQATTTHGTLLWYQSLSMPADDLLKVQQTLYVLTNDGVLSAWTSTNGTLLWVRQGVALPFGPWTALKSDGKLTLLGGEDCVIALNAASGKIVWQDDLDPSDGAQQLFIEHGILLVQTGSKIMALQSSTGTLLWQRESQIQALYIDQTRNMLYSVSIDVPDSVTQPNVPTWRGLRASDLATGKQLWTIEQSLTVTGASSISTNGILSSDGVTISAWDLEGKPSWQHVYAGSPMTQVVGVPQAGLDLLFAQDGTLTALDNQNGQQRWQQTLFPSQGYQFMISNYQYWIMSKEDGDITAYSLQGIKQWSLKLPPFEDITM